jgi:hypothetical protein
MLLDVVSVRTTQDFQLELGFQNGEQRRFDMRPLIDDAPASCTCRCTGLFTGRHRAATSILFHGGLLGVARRQGVI